MLPSPEFAEMGGVAIAELIKSAFKSAFGITAEKVSDVFKRVFEDFDPYMRECYKRNRYVRILCQDDDDVDLLGMYVQTSFSNKNRMYTDHEVGYEISEGSNIIIAGAGGAGKTFFMRKLWLDYFSGQSKTPVFIELKKFSDHSSTNVEAFIRSTLSQNITEALFRQLMLDGRFIFILDGFDELPREKLDEIQRQVLTLSDGYPGCRFIVSSRPDTRFSGWSSFKVFEAEPLTLVQTRELCQRVPFDQEYQKVFVKNLTEQFYKSYSSFLSNPLLAIMMMMTFKRNMNISRKMGIFYDEAFSTLYQWHDATKAYSRVKNLDIQQFRKSFGAFCLLSYAKEKFDFSRTELDDLIDQSSKLVGLNIERSKVLDDYERNVNLIRQDGLRYYFIHRSFQEYFAAWALVNLFPHKMAEFSEKIGLRASDNVISMCYDLHRSITVQNYLEPNFQKLKEKLNFGSNMDAATLWGPLCGSVLVIVSTEEFRIRRKKRSSIGVGLDVEKEFKAFYRSVQKMRGPDDTSRPDYSYSEPLIRADIATNLNGLLEKIFDEIVPVSSKKDRHLEYSISPSSDARIAQIEVNGPSLYALGSKISGVVELNDKEQHFLIAVGDEIAGNFNSAAAWCKGEVEFARLSDCRIDELFFSDKKE